MGQPRILIADDHLIFAEGLRRILEKEFEILGICQDGEQLINYAVEHHPDLIITDISMPKLNGIDAVKAIKRTHSDIKAIFLTMHRDIGYAARSFDAGASGYVLKTSISHELLTAIQIALGGDIYVTPTIAGRLMEYLKRHSVGAEKWKSGLSDRQRDILRLLSKGHAIKEIAWMLKVSPKTIEYHKYRIMDILKINSMAEMVSYAIDHDDLL